jgi:hypothetical protein
LHGGHHAEAEEIDLDDAKVRRSAIRKVLETDLG